jgi:hypothetical protein
MAAASLSQVGASSPAAKAGAAQKTTKARILKIERVISYL